MKCDFTYRGKDYTYDYVGKCATTDVDLGVDRRVLKITTQKAGNGGLLSSAQVVQRSEDGLGFSFVLFQDYNKTLARERTTRATNEAIRILHYRVLTEQLEQTLAEARAQYTKATV